MKIVGVLGLIDEGETDWKLLGIDIRDKLAAEVKLNIEEICRNILVNLDS